MPISRDDFERGRTEDSDEEKVLRLLDAGPGQAYTAGEIAVAIGHSSAVTPNSSDPDLSDFLSDWKAWKFEQYLDFLVGKGKIESRMIQDGTGYHRYYSARP